MSLTAPPTSTSSLRLPLLVPRDVWVWLGGGAALVNAALRVAIVPLFVVPVFDRVLAAGDLSALPSVLVVAAGVVVAGAVALLLQDALLGRAAAELAAHGRAELYKALLRRAPGQLPGTSGGLSSRILTDLKEIETYYQYGLGTLIAETFTLVGIVGVLFYYNVTATLALLLFGAPLAALLALLGRRLEASAQASQAGLEAVGAHLQEGLRHHASVRALAATPFMLGRFAEANERTRRVTVRRSVLAAVQTPSAQVLIFAAVAALVALLARSAARGLLSPGEVVSYLVLTLLLSTPAQLWPKGYAMLQQARAARARLLALDEARSAEIDEKAEGSGGEGLEFSDVSFAYTPGTPVLEAHSFTLPAQGLVALVGESGSGKTTLLQLCLRFLTPSTGAIYLQGAPLQSLSEAELRRRVSYVPQSPDLLRGTLLDNVRLGRDYSEAAVWRALGAAGLAETVRALPSGLDYELLEDGRGLSGGQRQRLAVARALLCGPAVLLLDEPSANLDAESERALVTTLLEQAEERLVLVVAHRPALIEAADVRIDLTPLAEVAP